MFNICTVRATQPLSWPTAFTSWTSCKCTRCSLHVGNIVKAPWRLIVFSMLLCSGLVKIAMYVHSSSDILVNGVLHKDNFGRSCHHILSFRGVVGYHVRLTRERSPVRTRTKAAFALCMAGTSRPTAFNLYIPGRPCTSSTGCQPCSGNRVNTTFSRDTRPGIGIHQHHQRYQFGLRQISRCISLLHF